MSPLNQGILPEGLMAFRFFMDLLRNLNHWNSLWGLLTRRIFVMIIRVKMQKYKVQTSKTKHKFRR